MTKILDIENAPIPTLTSEGLLNDSPFDSYVLLDVRRPQEWAEGHLPEAVHFPLDLLQAGQVPEIPTDKTIVVYCKAGVRSQTAIRILQMQGYSNLWNLKGGILAWTGEIINPSGDGYR